MSISVDKFEEQFGIEMSSEQISALMALSDSPDFLVFEEFLLLISKCNTGRCLREVMTGDERSAIKRAVEVDTFMTLSRFREDISLCNVPDSPVASHGK